MDAPPNVLSFDFFSFPFSGAIFEKNENCQKFSKSSAGGNPVVFTKPATR
jgi:hypothetical protein